MSTGHASQQRHLILHRRAMNERQYLERTGDSLLVDSILSISPARLERYLEVVRDTGVKILVGIMRFQPMKATQKMANSDSRQLTRNVDVLEEVDALIALLMGASLLSFCTFFE